MFRVILMVFILGALAAAIYCFSEFSFMGHFDKKITREDVIDNFIQHEDNFADLEVYFNSIIPKNKKQLIKFGLCERERISLIVYPSDGTGGDDQDISSSKIDSALEKIGWTRETVFSLKEKLSRTNCNVIRTTVSLREVRK